MSLEDGTYIYKLQGKKKPSYKIDGTTKDGEFLEIREPGMSHIGKYCKLKQYVNALLVSLQEKIKDHDDYPEAGTEVKKLHEQDSDSMEKRASDFSKMLEFAFGSATNVDMGEFVDIFKQMACNNRQSSVCVVDGKVAMTEAIWQTLDPVDAIGVTLRWCAFFTMPSEFQESNGSDSQSGSLTGVREL